MEKYLGNKRSLLPAIHRVIAEKCPDATSLFDIFAGTTNVARYFAARGFQPLVNDINRFSFLLAHCYVGQQEAPQFSQLSLPEISPNDLERFRTPFYKSVKKDAKTLFLQDPEVFFQQNLPLIKVLHYLNHLPESLSEAPIGDHSPTNSDPSSFITDFFTEKGKSATFTSQRGTQGHRNYFSPSNALHIDLILSTLRHWYQNQLINSAETALLLSTVIEEITLTANVSGTFHDFNRKRLWPNALQSFSLKIPLFNLSQKQAVITCSDAQQIAPQVPEHDILYLDPPYNFRQYTAYYHFLNFIAAYPFLENVASYLNDLAFVRGQNPQDDFDSDFCHKSRFIPALRKLIQDTPCRYVVMNYYGGRNHWNHWNAKERGNDEGFQLIKEVFGDGELFRNFEAIPVFQERLNYQSRGGEKKEVIDEYLFWGEKVEVKIGVEARVKSPVLAMHNAHFGLDFFS